MYSAIVDDEGTMYYVQTDELGSYVTKATDTNPPTLFTREEAIGVAEDMNNDLDKGQLFEFAEPPVGKFVPIFVTVQKQIFLPGGIDVEIH
jgi:hypothetical protein